MKDRGATSAGEPQIAGAHRVHLYLEQIPHTHGRGTIGNDVILGQITIRHRGARPFTPLTMIHGNTVTSEVK